jgi:alpha-L-rhamnosidase
MGESRSDPVHNIHYCLEKQLICVQKKEKTMIETTSLKIERLPAARGIVTPQPEFTWALTADRDGERQTACQIEVDRLAPGGGASPAWRSGKRVGLIGDEVRYAGEPLASRTNYRWRVRVWNCDDQASTWSAWAAFETGVIAPDQIAGQWIAGGGALRRQIHVSEGLVRARAYVTGLGYYEFFCNGRKVSAAALAPSFTEFERRVEYEVIDLTPALAAGANGVGFLLADGWWRHGAEARKSRINQALAEIVLEYADGRRDVVVTDDSWQAADGPLMAGENESPHQLFDGVALDLGWLASGWCTAGGGNEGWQAAKVAGAGVGQLVPSLLPPIREVESLKPVVVKRLSDRLLSIDFGQNYAGWVRFRATAARGTRLVVRHAELLRPDGRLNLATLRSAKQTDTFLLAGTPGEAVEPRFLQHGLRYAEIEGPIDIIATDSIEGVVVHTDLEPVGTVTTSDDRINWLLATVRWTVRGNAMSVMTDDHQRDERRGWLMDGVMALKAGLLFFDMAALARKWVEDMIDNQEADGSLRGDCAPAWFPCKSVGWQRAIVLVPMAIYECCGDRGLLERAFPHMRRYADYLLANLKDDLVPPGFSWHPVEWLCIGKRNDHLGDNAVTIDVLRKVARAAEVLGKTEGAHFAEVADRIAAAAHRRWHQSGTGIFGGGGGEGYAQSNQVYSLRFGLAAPEVRQSVFDSLVFDLLQARGDGPFVTTGTGSTEHLPIVLSAFGRDDIVWQWLQRDAYPGYGFMQRHGATAIWECWEQRTDDGMNAHNHTGLSGIGTWLMQYLVGIRVAPGPEPVFHLRPAVHLPLTALDARWQSRWGAVEVSWVTVDEGKQLTVSIPPGCRARLELAGGGEVRELGSGRHQNIAWKSPAKNMSNTSPTTAGQTGVRSEYKLKTTGDFALPADWSLYRPDGFVLPRLTPRPAGHNVAQENQAHLISI